MEEIEILETRQVQECSVSELVTVLTNRYWVSNGWELITPAQKQALQIILNHPDTASE